MPFDIAPLVAPSSTALFLSELQSSIADADTELAVAVKRILPTVVELVDAARESGVQVVHALKYVRRDALGRNSNIALYKRQGTAPGAGPRPEPDSRLVDGTQVLPELGPDERDFVIGRFHGMSAVSDTGVDPLLRTFGARTVVVAGISLNVGIPNVVMDLANRGYEVVVPRDACAGVPASYEDQVIEHTIKMLASVTTTARLVEAWRAAG
jgi:nicotinamidase-related amidase